MPDTASLEAAEAADLLAAAAKRKRGGGGRKNGKAAESPAKGRKRRRRAEPESQPVLSREDWSSEMLADLPPAQRQTTTRASSPGRLPRVLALVAIGTTITLALLAHWRVPGPGPLASLVIGEGADVPRPLLARWLAAFPSSSELAADPDRPVLQEFADFLAGRPAVAAVHRVGIGWTDSRQPKRVLQVDLTLREPVLPVARAGGRIDWVDAEGVVLPGELAGPDGEPRVTGIEAAHPAAMQEVLTVWPQLKEALLAADREHTFSGGPELISGIDLHAPLNQRGDHGIVFRTSAGTRLVWGQAGEAVYGIDAEQKITNLIHTLSCQGRHAGDLRHVEVINVRFDEPFAVVQDDSDRPPSDS